MNLYNKDGDKFYVSDFLKLLFSLLINAVFYFCFSVFLVLLQEWFVTNLPTNVSMPPNNETETDHYFSKILVWKNNLPNTIDK